MDRKKYKEPVDLIAVDKGICRVVHPDTGEVVDMCCRGLHRWQKENIGLWPMYVESGVFNPAALNLTELPNTWDVKYERTDIMGPSMTSVKDFIRAAKKIGVI